MTLDIILINHVVNAYLHREVRTKTNPVDHSVIGSDAVVKDHVKTL